MKRKLKTTGQAVLSGDRLPIDATYTKDMSLVNATYTAVSHKATGGNTTYTTGHVQPRVTANTTYDVSHNRVDDGTVTQDSDMDCEQTSQRTYTAQIPGTVDLGSSLFVQDGDATHTNEYVKPLSFDSSEALGRLNL